MAAAAAKADEQQMQDSRRRWPFSVYFSVMAYSDVTTLCLSRRVCRNFHELSEYPQLWMYLVGRDFPHYHLLSLADKDNSDDDNGGAAAGVSNAKIINQRKKNPNHVSSASVVGNTGRLGFNATIEDRAQFIYELGDIFFCPGRAIYSFVSLANHFPTTLSDIVSRSKASRDHRMRLAAAASAAAENGAAAPAAMAAAPAASAASKKSTTDSVCGKKGASSASSKPNNNSNKRGRKNNNKNNNNDGTAAEKKENNNNQALPVYLQPTPQSDQFAIQEELDRMEQSLRDTGDPFLDVVGEDENSATFVTRKQLLRLFTAYHFKALGGVDQTHVTRSAIGEFTALHPELAAAQAAAAAKKAARRSGNKNNKSSNPTAKQIPLRLLKISAPREGRVPAQLFADLVFLFHKFQPAANSSAVGKKLTAMLENNNSERQLRDFFEENEKELRGDAQRLDRVVRLGFDSIIHFWGAELGISGFAIGFFLAVYLAARLLVWITTDWSFLMFFVHGIEMIFAPVLHAWWHNGGFAPTLCWGSWAGVLRSVDFWSANNDTAVDQQQQQPQLRRFPWPEAFSSSNSSSTDLASSSVSFFRDTRFESSTSLLCVLGVLVGVEFFMTSKIRSIERRVKWLPRFRDETTTMVYALVPLFWPFCFFGFFCNFLLHGIGNIVSNIWRWLTVSYAFQQTVFTSVLAGIAPWIRLVLREDHVVRSSFESMEASVIDKYLNLTNSTPLNLTATATSPVFGDYAAQFLFRSPEALRDSAQWVTNWPCTCIFLGAACAFFRTVLQTENLRAEIGRLQRNHSRVTGNAAQRSGYNRWSMNSQQICRLWAAATERVSVAYENIFVKKPAPARIAAAAAATSSNDDISTKKSKRSSSSGSRYEALSHKKENEWKETWLALVEWRTGVLPMAQVVLFFSGQHLLTLPLAMVVAYCAANLATRVQAAKAAHVAKEVRRG